MTYPLPHLHFFSTKTINVTPKISCDKRGHNTLYWKDHQRSYFLLDLSDQRTYTNHPMYHIYTNNASMKNTHKLHKSTCITPNTKYIIGKYLEHFFTNQTYIPRSMSSRYFDCLRNLLCEKLNAIRKRLESLNPGNRLSTTYLRFSYKKHTTYLGFYLPCRHEINNNKTCILPVAAVRSQS